MEAANSRRKLPLVMPHYDHGRTCTVDVVWEVIIPETSSKGCAYADLMNEGPGRLPDKMVHCSQHQKAAPKGIKQRSFDPN
eukprot:5412773-Amphidinium_carterae.2